MTANQAPLISVVLVAHCDSGNLRLAINRLKSQTIADRLELILVTERRKNLEAVEPALSGFLRVQTVEVGDMRAPGAAKAAGVRSASAPLVAFVEDHSYPAPDCAEALVAAHADGKYAAVGPVVLNANPATAASWACYLIFYSAWMPGAACADADHLPGNQSCYRRDLLMSYGSRLEEVLGSESVLHWELRSKGHKLRLEARALLYHLQFSARRPVWKEYFLASRAFAADRASQWGAARRAAFALGSPLLPAIRLPRIWRQAVKSGTGRVLLARSLPDMLAVLGAGTAGEMMGYALGPGDAARRLIEFERTRHLDFTRRDLDAATRIL